MKSTNIEQTLDRWQRESNEQMVKLQQRRSSLPCYNSLDFPREVERLDVERLGDHQLVDGSCPVVLFGWISLRRDSLLHSLSLSSRDHFTSTLFGRNCTRYFNLLTTESTNESNCFTSKSSFVETERRSFATLVALDCHSL